MFTTKNRSRPVTPVRARSPHSMMIAASNAPSTAGAMTMSWTPGNAISGAGAGSALTTTASLPIRMPTTVTASIVWSISPNNDSD